MYYGRFNFLEEANDTDDKGKGSENTDDTTTDDLSPDSPDPVVDDTAEPEDDTSGEEGTTDNTADESGDDTTTDDTDGNTDSDTSSDTEDSPESPTPPEDPNADKKPFLINSLVEIQNLIESIRSTLQEYLSSDLEISSRDTYSQLLEKVTTNYNLLSDLLGNQVKLDSKTFAELKVIHTIYLSDAETMGVAIAKLANYLKSQNKSK